MEPNNMLCRLLDATSVELCGAKAVALSNCLQAGAKVPNGLIVTTSSLRSQLDGAISEEEIRCRILKSPLEASVKGVLQEVYDWAISHGATSLIVRSSAPIEDSKRLSFAGQFRSIFIPLRLESIEDAVRNVWISMLNAVVPKGYEHPLQMAVIVQLALRPRRSGVAFIEWSLGKPRMYIETTLGLAIPLVSGMVRPDQAKSKPGHNLELEFSAGSKTICVLPGTADESDLLPGEYVSITLSEGSEPAKLLFVDAEQQLIWLRVPPMHVSRCCLDQELAARVSDIVYQLSTYFCDDLDVEWAEDESGALWIVQARPMTAPLPSGQPITSEGSISGLGVSSGSAQGAVHILHSEEGVDLVPHSGVLVCGAAKPQYMPAIARSAAIVSADGGMLCHVAIVARELGKPCVVGIHDALERFTNGDVLYVDGDLGHVSRLTGISAISGSEPERLTCERQRDSITINSLTLPHLIITISESHKCVILFATMAVVSNLSKLVETLQDDLAILLPAREVCNEGYIEQLRTQTEHLPVSFGDGYEVRWLRSHEGQVIDISTELLSLQNP